MSNFSDKFKAIVGTLAPTVATALGGPFAGAAVGALAKSLGLGTQDPVAIEKAVLAADPAALAQIKIAEIDLQKTLADLGVQEDQLAYADTASARAREIAVKDSTPAVLAYSITAGFFGVLGYLLVCGKPTNGGDALLVMLGALGGAWGCIVSYYFGSSISSKGKTDALAALAGKR